MEVRGVLALMEKMSSASGEARAPCALLSWPEDVSQSRAATRARKTDDRADNRCVFIAPSLQCGNVASVNGAIIASICHKEGIQKGRQ